MTRKKGAARNRRLPGGALFIISMLMIGSATLRIGLQAGPAIAREAMNSEVAHRASPISNLPGAATSEEMQALIIALKDREESVKLKEGQIEDRMNALGIAEEALKKRLQALITAEEKLASTLALADVASENDLAGLTSVYEKMKPKQSAALFEEMDPEFAAGFLARMQPEAAARLMAGLSPVAAYSISVVLAGRNASVPTE